MLCFAYKNLFNIYVYFYVKASHILVKFTIKCTADEFLNITGVYVS